jgi:Lar family restriction alleviation protein
MTTEPSTTTQETRELKPCPFCGLQSKIEDFFIDDDPQPWHVATCTVCPVKTYDQQTPQEAARIWNTRAPSDTEQVTEPHKKINFLTVLEHQAHRNHEYRPGWCAECTLTQAIAERLREELGLTTRAALQPKAEQEQEK